MFLPNKYTAWYHALVAKRKAEQPIGCSESHHIIPKSLGGTNATSNLVRLTAREHFVAHRLLAKMVEGDPRRRMIFALSRTTSSCKHKPSSRTIAFIREQYASQLRGVPRTAETKQRISEAVKGFKMPEEAKAKISAAFTGRPKSDSFKRKMSERLNDAERDAARRAKISASSRGRVMSEETKRKLSETRKRKHAEGTLRSRWTERP